MASPRRTESESVPIWLKLSEDDAAQMEQVLARPEFAGWTRAEWCLEIIQTALRYYARRPVAEPGRERGSAKAQAGSGEAQTGSAEASASSLEAGASRPGVGASRSGAGSQRTGTGHRPSGAGGCGPGFDAPA